MSERENENLSYFCRLALCQDSPSTLRQVCTEHRGQPRVEVYGLLRGYLGKYLTLSICVWLSKFPRYMCDFVVCLSSNFLLLTAVGSWQVLWCFQAMLMAFPACRDPSQTNQSLAPYVSWQLPDWFRTDVNNLQMWSAMLPPEQRARTPYWEWGPWVSWQLPSFGGSNGAKTSKTTVFLQFLSCPLPRFLIQHLLDCCKPQNVLQSSDCFSVPLRRGAGSYLPHHVADVTFLFGL